MIFNSGNRIGNARGERSRQSSNPQIITRPRRTRSEKCRLREAMDAMEEIVPPRAPYNLHPSRYCSEDILFCIDVDKESLVEMKNPGINGRPITRLDSIKQSIVLFMNAKLSINPDHRFAFSLLGRSTTWLRKEFSGDMDSAFAALRSITGDSSGGHADLTQLFRIAAHEAKKCRALNRSLRVILIYCRSSLPPVFQWPVNEKLFTLDVIYLHDKPTPDNCPQKVYDALVEALESVTENEGYIFESGQGLQRILFRQMCTLLSHPQQRCIQDDIDVPKVLQKKTPPNEQPTQRLEIL